MKPQLRSLFVLSTLWILGGCQSASTIDYFEDASYRDARFEEPKSPLLFQYKFINPVEEHEILILDESKKQYQVRVKLSQANEGFVINLPTNHEYAIASFFLINENSKKELQLGKSLLLFKLSQDKLTRIRGFDIINDKDPSVNSISIAPWDSLTDNLLIIEASKRFQVPEKAIRTINIFKN